MANPPVTSTGAFGSPPLTLRALADRLEAIELALARLQQSRTPPPLALHQLSDASPMSAVADSQVPTYNATTGLYEPRTGGTGTGTFNISQTYAVAGPVVGITLPPFFVPPSATGETLTLIEIDYASLSGSGTLGVSSGPFSVSGLTVTTTPVYFTGSPLPYTLVPGETVQVAIASGSTIVGLTVSLVIKIVT